MERSQEAAYPLADDIEVVFVEDLLAVGSWVIYP